MRESSDESDRAVAKSPTWVQTRARTKITMHYMETKPGEGIQALVLSSKKCAWLKPVVTIKDGKIEINQPALLATLARENGFIFDTRQRDLVSCRAAGQTIERVTKDKLRESVVSLIRRELPEGYARNFSVSDHRLTQIHELFEQEYAGQKSLMPGSHEFHAANGVVTLRAGHVDLHKYDPTVVYLDKRSVAYDVEAGSAISRSISDYADNQDALQNALGRYVVMSNELKEVTELDGFSPFLAARILSGFSHLRGWERSFCYFGVRKTNGEMEGSPGFLVKAPNLPLDPFSPPFVEFLKSGMGDYFMSGRSGYPVFLPFKRAMLCPNSSMRFGGYNLSTLELGSADLPMEAAAMAEMGEKLEAGSFTWLLHSAAKFLENQSNFAVK